MPGLELPSTIEGCRGSLLLLLLSRKVLYTRARSVLNRQHGLQWGELLTAARHGDQDALNAVWGKLRKYLLIVAQRGLNRSLRGKLDASDIVQQSMMEAHESLLQFNGDSEGELRSWLIRLVENNLVDADRHFRGTQQRDVSREVSIHTRALQGGVLDRSPDALTVLSLRESNQKLTAAIAALPDQRRIVLELRSRDRLSYAAIGRIMGLTEVAARKLWSRAVSDLRETLAKQDD